MCACVLCIYRTAPRRRPVLYTATMASVSTTTGGLSFPDKSLLPVICCSGGATATYLTLHVRPSLVPWTLSAIVRTRGESSRPSAPTCEPPRLWHAARTIQQRSPPPTASPPWDRKSSSSRKWRSMTRNRAPGGCSSPSEYWCSFSAYWTSCGAGSFTGTAASGPAFSYVYFAYSLDDASDWSATHRSIFVQQTKWL